MGGGGVGQRKASTYIRHQTQKYKDKHPCIERQNHDLSNKATKIQDVHKAATVIKSERLSCKIK
jgi:hypothetical protein